MRAHSVELVRKAIADGANVDVKDSQGSTPLMFDSAQGFTDIVSVLLEKRMDRTGLLKL